MVVGVAPGQSTIHATLGAVDGTYRVVDRAEGLREPARVQRILGRQENQGRVRQGPAEEMQDPEIPGASTRQPFSNRSLRDRPQSIPVAVAARRERGGEGHDPGEHDAGGRES